MMTGTHKSLGSIVFRVIALALAVATVGCGRPAPRSGGKMLVAASIAPMYDFSRQVGGDFVDVTMLVPPDSNPHVYQLEPGQMETLGSAAVLVLNGVQLEYWAAKAVDAAGNPKLTVVDTAKGLRIVDAGNDPDHPGGNPHVWLDPVMAVHQVEAIRDGFIKADPKHRAAYTANAARFVSKLRDLDKEIRSDFEGLKSREFVTLHPSWTYFARRYGLVQAGVIEKSPGREPTPSEIGEVIDATKRAKVMAIFAEPQFSPKAADVIAHETGAKVILVDAFGKPPEYSYMRTMRDNVAKIVEALK